MRAIHRLAVATACLTSIAFADDLTPPPWRASDPSWTVQEWEFFTPAVPNLPDGNMWGANGVGYVNPFGTPMLTSVGSSPWTSAWGSRLGAFVMVDPQALLKFDIPNGADPNGSKLIRVQATWNPVFSGTGLLNASVNAPGGPFNPVQRVDTHLSEGFIHSSFDFVLPTCPAIEQVSLTHAFDTVVVDQVVVDTICVVPEPATMAAIGLGFAAVLARKRRKS